MPVLFGGHNLPPPPLVEIGLHDMPKSGGAPAPTGTTGLILSRNRIHLSPVERPPFKAELPQEGILFRTQFSSLGNFINEKVGFRKN